MKRSRIAFTLVVLMVGCAKPYHATRIRRPFWTLAEKNFYLRNESIVDAKAGIGHGKIVYFPANPRYTRSVVGGHYINTDFLYRKNGKLTVANLRCEMGIDGDRFVTGRSHVTDWKPEELKAWDVPTDVPKPLAKELLAQK